MPLSGELKLPWTDKSYLDLKLSVSMGWGAVIFFSQARIIKSWIFVIKNSTIMKISN